MILADGQTFSYLPSIVCGRARCQTRADWAEKPWRLQPAAVLLSTVHKRNAYECSVCSKTEVTHITKALEERG